MTTAQTVPAGSTGGDEAVYRDSSGVRIKDDDIEMNRVADVIDVRVERHHSGDHL